MLVIHSTVGTSDSNLYQFRVSGKEIEYKQAIRKKLETRTNVTLQNEEYNKLSNKFVEKKPALSPKIKVSIKLDIQAYKAHSSPLEQVGSNWEEPGRKGHGVCDGTSSSYPKQPSKILGSFFPDDRRVWRGGTAW